MITVIDPGVHTPETDTFNHLQRILGKPCSYHLPTLDGMESLFSENVRGIKGMVILGSAASVNDGLPWQKQLHPWVREKALSGIPTVGICYGHQMIAHAFGGKVGYVFLDRHKEQGFRRIHFQNAAPYTTSPLEGELFVSHREEVKELPGQFEVIASSDVVKVEVMRHAQLPIVSFQPHPEATSVFAKNVCYPKPVQIKQFEFGYSVLGQFLRILMK